jgi:MFS family permease
MNKNWKHTSSAGESAQIDAGYVFRIIIVAALGGLLFGYDTAVISGAIGFLQAHFELSPAYMGWAASSALIGCIIGVAIAGLKFSGSFSVICPFRRVL